MDITSILDSLTNLPPWTIYLVIFGFPFVQEDAAVIGAATLTAMGTVKLGPAVVAIVLGLFFSDIWKYWIGWAALKNKKGAAFAEREKIMSLKDKVQTYPFATMMMARFVPLTRIPVYFACGFFKISYIKYCIYIAFSAILFVAIIFAVVLTLGAIMAEHLKWAMPVFGVVLAGSIIGFLVWRNRICPEDDDL